MDKEIVWATQDHNHTKKDAEWFWVLGIIAVSTIIVAILFHNFFFAALVLVAALTIGMLAKRDPQILTCKLNSQGLLIGEYMHPFSSMSAFWIDEDATTPILLIDTTNIFTPHLFITVPKHRAKEIHKFISQYVPEENLKEPLSHKAMKWFGF